MRKPEYWENDETWSAYREWESEQSKEEKKFSSLQELIRKARGEEEPVIPYRGFA